MVAGRKYQVAMESSDNMHRLVEYLHYKVTELNKLKQELEVYRKRLENAQLLMLDGGLYTIDYRVIKKPNRVENPNVSQANYRF
jgi:hypothetical protein